jgi:hypothetical protein
MDTNNAQMPITRQADELQKPRRRRRPYNARNVRPFTVDQLDKRTAAYAMFENLYTAVESDCGGADQISAVKRQLIAMFCSMSVYANDLSARGLAGQEIELADLSRAAMTLTRLAMRLGVNRKPRSIGGMSLGELRRADIAQQRDEARTAHQLEQQSEPVP